MVQRQKQQQAAERLNSSAGSGGLRALAAFAEVMKATAARIGDQDQLWVYLRVREICELPGDVVPSRPAQQCLLEEWQTG